MRALSLLTLLLAIQLAPSPSHGAPAPEAGPITPQNLLESERFWPYHVALAAPWTPPGRESPLAKGTRGVLIRIGRNGMARIDFGRHGLYQVPVSRTDLVEGANQVRKGERLKPFPNLVLAIAPRLLDPKDMSRLTPARLADRDRILCVFADPAAEGFPALVKELASLPPRDGTAMVLFSQGRSTDAELADRLRSLDWSGSFVLAVFAQAYTRSLLSEGTPMPFLQLATGEGRVLFESAWDPANAQQLRAALAEALGGGASRSTLLSGREGKR